MSFKTEFQRYKKAVEDDIKELEIVICWLEMTADANVSGVPKAEIAKLVSFYKGTKDSKQVEKKKIDDLERNIENNWKKYLTNYFSCNIIIISKIERGIENERI